MGPEDRLQEMCIKWFRIQWPKALVFSIPNAAKRSFRLAALLKRTGLVSGVPDLCIPEPRGVYCGLWIEMKSAAGRLTPEQSKMLFELRGRGYFTEMCNSFESFQTCVRGYMELGKHVVKFVEEPWNPT